MSIDFACPTCKTTYTVQDRDAGKKSDCKKCGQRLQVPAPPKASIQFSCPICKTSYTVDEQDAGKKSACKSCGQRLQVPGPPSRMKTVLGEVESGGNGLPNLLPEPVPTFTPTVESQNTPKSEMPFPNPGFFSRRTSRGEMGPANRILASIGSGFLLIGLFLPMIQAPFGFWLSFIDVPWKAVTVGFAVADEMQERQREPENFPRTERRKPDRRENEKPDRSAIALPVAIASVIYPLFILAAIGVSAWQITQGRTAKNLLFIGIACFGTTVGYGLSILALNAIPELRVVMVLVSPGFGWAVLLIGSAMLMASGAIRFEKA